MIDAAPTALRCPRRRTFRPGHSMLALLGTLALVTSAPAPAQIETTWLGPGGDWMDPALWSLGVPGAADTGVIGTNAGTLTLAVDQQIYGFIQSGGTLLGDATLSVLGPARWDAGVQGGAGTTSFLGTLQVDGAGTHTISGPRRVVVGAIATWTGNTAAGNGTISMTTSGGVSTLRIEGEFREAQGFDHALTGSSSARIEVEGRWHKLSGATTTVSPSLHNHGEVRLDAGRLRLGGGGSHSGLFDIGADAVLELAGGAHTFAALTTTTGAGMLHVSGGTAGFEGSQHNVRLLLSGGLLTGTEHRQQGPTDWAGGAIGGAGTTTFAGALAIDGAGTHAINGPRTVVVDTNAIWSGNTAAGNGLISMTTSGGVSTLRVVGSLVESQAFDHAIIGSAAARVEVPGLWHKTGDATTSVGPSFHNDGEVRLDAGRLRLAGGGEHHGLFAIGEDAVLELAGGTHLLTPTSAANGNGMLHVSGGTADLQAGAHSARLLLSGGTLAGADHRLSGDARFTGGAIRGAATTTITGTTTISGDAIKQLAVGRTLVLAGDATWEGNTGAGNGTFFLGSTGGATALRVEGRLEERQNFDHNFSGNGTLTVTGQWHKTSDTRSSITTGVTFDNQGLVEVAAGTLQVARSFTNEGTIEVHAGAAFESTCFAGGGVCFRNAGLMKGSGNVKAPATGLHNTGTIAPGHSIGTLTVDGPLTLAAGSVLQIELASAGFDYLVVAGDLTLGGELALWNAGYAPVLGDHFEILRFSAVSGGFELLSWHGFGRGVAFDHVLRDDGLRITVTAVPEPATWLTLLAGLALIGTRRWRLTDALQPK
jgi:hypothetical protein